MNPKKINDNGRYLKGFLILILGLIIIILFARFVVIPNAISFIKWAVPNFWSLIGYIIILWLIFKFFQLLWTPIKSIFGKWSYIILLATFVYVLLQVI
ncbi:hypothetical protein ACWO4B_003223 [Clostridium sporogenes]